MRIRRKNRFAAEVSTSSLNDIMFFLLFFFFIIVVSSPGIINVSLPKATSSLKSKNRPISLKIDYNSSTGSKEYFLDNTKIPFNELEVALKNLVLNNNNTNSGEVEINKLIIGMNKSLPVQDLVDVLQITTKLKIKVVMATDKG
jgi:biopolymer transport protein ExbD